MKFQSAILANSMSDNVFEAECLELRRNLYEEKQLTLHLQNELEASKNVLTTVLSKLDVLLYNV